MQIGGFLKFSIIDYPDRMAAVIFTRGCNFRCPYCYNPELAIPEKYQKGYDEEEVLAFLKRRRGFLEGVVVTGGEPTVQKDLLVFLGKLKRLEYAVKLDTNGSHPRMLKEVIRQGLVDYIAMDVKAPLKKYERVVGVRFNVRRVRESIGIIRDCGLAHEFRTTMVKPLVSPEDVPQIIASVGKAQRYVIQRFIPSEKIIDKKLLKKPQYSEKELADLRARWQTVRGYD